VDPYILDTLHGALSLHLELCKNHRTLGAPYASNNTNYPFLYTAHHTTYYDAFLAAKGLYSHILSYRQASGA